MATGYLVTLGNGNLDVGDAISGTQSTFDINAPIGNGQWTWSGVYQNNGQSYNNINDTGVFYLGTDGNTYFIPDTYFITSGTASVTAVPTPDGTVSGSAGDDIIDGSYTDLDGDSVSAANDTIYADDGNDTVYSGAGDDVVFGERGNDTLTTGAGNDTAYGGGGADVIDTGDNNDVVYGGSGNDSIDAGAGADTVYAGSGSDTVEGGAGIDFIRGGSGDDVITDSGTTADTILGESGNDSISAGAGNDVVSGGSGTDTIDGGDGADTIEGNAGDDSILGGDGSDVLIGDTDDVAVTGAEALNWTDEGAAGTNLNGSFTQNTGGVSVSVEVTNDGNADRMEVSNTAQYTETGEPFAANSALILTGGGGATATAAITFDPNLDTGLSDEVENVQFRINDIDSNSWQDIVTVNAFDADGNPVTVVLTPASVTGTAADDTVSGNTITAGTTSESAADAAGSVLVTIAGPVHEIEIIYDNGDTGGQALWVTDIHFDTTALPAADEGNDTIDGGLGDDYIEGNGGDDSLDGGAGNDSVYGGDGDDFITDGGGSDSLFGGFGNDEFEIDDADGADVIVGGEDGNLLDVDVLDLDQNTANSGVTVTATGAEAGTYDFDGTAGAGSYSEIEEIDGTFYDDTFDMSADNSGVSIDANEGADSIIGGDGNDNIEAGSGADTIDAGAGDDTIDLANGSGTPDGDADVIVLQDGSGNDTIREFDAPTPNGDGTFTGIDTFDVTNLTDGVDPVDVFDVTVTDDGSGNAVLTFPNNESVTLIGIDPAVADNPQWLIAAGIPGPDGTVEGTSGDDSINASYTGDPDGDMVDNNDAILPGDTGDDDLIYGYGGNDNIFSGDGNDEVYGGEGNDLIQDGGIANSTLDGGAGDDRINSGAGDDTVYGGTGDDTIGASIGSDEVYGGDGNDTMAAGGFAGAGDTLDGGAGNDTISGGAGNDTVFGGTGDDSITINAQAGTDSIEGGEDVGGGDVDTLNFIDLVGPEGVAITMTGDEAGSYSFPTQTGSGTFSEIEQFNLTTSNDTFDGTAATGGSTVDGDAGDDVLTGGSGDDSFIGGTGNDTLNANGGDDTLSGGSGNDVIYGDDGNDSIDGGDDNDELFGGNDNDTVFGGAGDDTLFGGNGQDTLTGGDGADTITGGADQDVIYGGVGDVIDGSESGVDNDTLIVSDVDYIDYATNPENGTVYFNGGGSLTFTNIENVVVSDRDGTVSGTAGNDTIDGSYVGDPDGDIVDNNDAILVGDSGDDDLIEAGAGNDTVLAGDGNDEIYAGTGDDSVRGGIGDDTVFGGDGDDLINVGNGTDTVFGGAGADTAYGSLGDSTLYGGADNDLLDGQYDNNDIFGGQGDDLIYVQEFADTNVIEGGEDVGNGDNDEVRFFEDTSLQGVDVTFTGDEAATFDFDGSTSTGSFTEIESVTGTDFDDTIDATASSSDQTLSGDDGDDTITGGSGADLLIGGADADVIYGGAGDVIDGSETGDDNDTLIVSDVDYIDYATNTENGTVYFNGGGSLTFTNIENVIVSDRDGTVSGTAGDDTINNSYNGDPDGDVVDGNDAILVGDTGNDDLIEAGAGNDSILANTGDDEIYAGTGDDFVTAGSGDDTVFGEAGEDLMFGFDGSDTIYGGADDDIMNGGVDNDSLYGGAGADIFVQEEGFGTDVIEGGETGVDDDLMRSTQNGDVTITATGDESGTLTDGVNVATFSEIERLETEGGDDVVDISADSSGMSIETGAGDDTITGGSGDDVMDGASGDDTIALQDGFGNDTISGGETGETSGDTLDASDVTADLIVDLSTVQPTNPEAGTLTDGVNTASFEEIETILLGSGDDSVTGSTGDENIDLGSGADTIDAGEGDDTINLGENGLGAPDGDADVIILQDDFGSDTITNFDAPTPVGDGTFTGIDTFDVTLLTDGTDPVNTNDVTVTDDGSGNAVLTFPNNESVTLIGITPAQADDPFWLNAVGIPLPDGTVSGTSGADTIDASYTGDPDGDVVDGGDAILPGDSGDDDLIEAGAGNDTINAGAGNDEIYAEEDNDRIIAGTGNDTAFGGDGNDLINAGSGDDTLYGGDGNDSLTSGDGTDTAFGGAGNDVFQFDDADGTNTIVGGETGETNGDILNTNSDTDVTVVSTGDEAGVMTQGTTSVTFSEIEIIQTDSGNDTVDISNDTSGMDILTYAGDDSVIGGRGDDSITGFEGDDTLEGGAGADTIFGGTGNDTLIIAEGDSAFGGQGDDVFVLEDLGEPTNGTITIDGGAGDETGGDTLQLGGIAPLTSAIIDTFVDDGTGSYSGSVTLNDGTILNFSEIENIICFTPQTRIATPLGLVNVEDLEVGDLVVTRDHGLQPIRWIEGRTVPAVERFAPVRISKNVLAGQDRDLIVSPQHRVLFQGYRAELLFGESEVLVSAKHLIDGLDVTQVEAPTVTYVHMLFDHHEIIFAEGAATESFHPGDIGFSAVTDEAREELFAIFPELRVDPRAYGATARRCLKQHEAKLIRV